MTLPEAPEATFRYARGKLLGYALGGVGFAAAASWIAYARLAPAGSVEEFMIWAGIPFFGAIGAKALWTLREAGEVVRISSRGITDVRIAPEIIPWRAIRGVKVQEMKGQHFIMIEVDRGFEESLSLTGMVRWTRAANAALGFDGLVVNPAGLDATVEELIGAVRRFRPNEG